MSGPSREDIIFGRAVIAFRLATKEQVEACAADQQRLLAQGRALTLPQVMVGRRLLSIDQYRGIVAEIAKRLGAQAAPVPSTVSQPSAETDAARFGARQVLPVPAEVRTASRRLGGTNGGPVPLAPRPSPLLPPDLTATGRYRERMGEPLARGLAEERPAPLPSDEEIEEAARSWEHASRDLGATDIMPQSAEGRPGVPGGTVTTPHAARERRDVGIRKVLGVPEDADEFDFGPYRITGQIAAGGMGVIYRAVETTTGSVYALKALLNVENANEKQLKRFVQEAQSAMRLDHPGIVKIYDLGVYENIPYFTMDLVPGKDLYQVLKEGVSSREQMLEILRRTCLAVDYAHEKGVIHRDLKPANIIVRPDGTPILTDFGLAKNLDSQFKLTAEGTMVGTPLYLSPEQVASKGVEVDARCDVYGLGVMLYEILTGELPFTGRNPYEVYRKVTEEDPRPPRSIDPSLSPEIERVCLQALAKNRDERYPSARALSEDLGRFLRGEPVQAKLPTPMRQGSSADASRPSNEGARAETASLRTILGVAAFAIVVLCLVAYIVYALVAPA